MAITPHEAPLIPFDSVTEYSDLQEVETLVRNDRYIHTTFTEQSDPVAVDRARKAHAIGYERAGFVTKDAVTEEGHLVPELDGSRGEHTDYHLAVLPENEKNESTLRVDNLPEGGTYKDLPAYRLAGHALYPYAVEYLESIPDQHLRVKEIGALAQGEEGTSLGAHELFRKIIHESMGKGEVWFFTIVTPAYGSLTATYGSRNFEVIGDDVAIPDDRVDPNLRLKPTLVHPDNYIENIQASHKDVSTMLNTAIDQGDVRTQRQLRRQMTRLEESLVFFTEGLDADKMSSSIQTDRILFQANIVARAEQAEMKRQQRAAEQLGSRVAALTVAETA